MTMSISRARRSVNFPLPSSPHWVPTTTVAGTGLPRELPRCPSSLPHPISPSDQSLDCDDAVERVDGDRVAVVEIALQERKCQGIFEPSLDDSLERPSPKSGIESLARQRGRRGWRHVQDETSFSETSTQTTQLDPDNLSLIHI